MLWLQRKGGSGTKQQEQAKRDQEQQEGMRWLAEQYWNVYLVCAHAILCAHVLASVLGCGCRCKIGGVRTLLSTMWL